MLRTAVDPVELVQRAMRHGLMPEPILNVSEWAAEHRYLSQKASAEPGRWNNDRTPYLVEIMDCLSPRHPAREIVFMKGAQVGGTEAGNNWIGYVIDQAPGPMMAVLPTVDMARRTSRQRLEPLIDESPRLRSKVADRRARDSSNTIFSKDFPGGTLVLTGANSATGLRSMPARYLFFDEVDGYPGDVGGEGDPVNLAKRRTATFSRRKILAVSTPTIEGRSRIATAFEESDQRRYHVPCPECDHFQTIDWKRIVWEEDDPGTVHLACEECGHLIAESAKTDMLARGRWIAAVPGRPIRGYHLSALYSPVGWYSWAEAVADFLKAKDDPDQLRTWTNTVLGETWRQRGDAPPWEALYRRRESYRRNTVPKGAKILTAGVDVQGDRLELEIVGWGPRYESWSIDYRVLMGDPSQAEVWAGLDEVLAESFPAEDGETDFVVAKLAIDSGGHNTQDVYAWASRQAQSRVMAIQGRDALQVPVGTVSMVDLNHRGRKRKRGGRLWPVGVSLIKSELYSWWRQEAPLEEGDPLPIGWSHFPEYDQAHFQALTAEELVTRKVRGYTRAQWEKIRERNEQLDCRVYARAALWTVGAQRWRDDDRWETARRKHSTPSASKPPASVRKRKRRERRGNGWVGADWDGVE